MGWLGSFVLSFFEHLIPFDLLLLELDGDMYVQIQVPWDDNFIKVGLLGDTVLLIQVVTVPNTGAVMHSLMVWTRYLFKKREHSRTVSHNVFPHTYI